MARSGRINSRDIRRMAQKIQKEFNKHPISVPLKANVDMGDDFMGDSEPAEPCWDSWAEGFHARTDVRGTRLLDWLYDHGASVGFTSISEFLEEHGDGLDVGFALSDHLVSAGFARSGNTLGAVMVKLTSSGVARVEDIRQRRADRARRISDMRRQMLRWLFGQEERGEQPQSWADFVESGPSHLAGEQPFSQTEVRRQSKFLDEEGFVESTTVAIEEEEPGWFSPRTTPRGQDCILRSEGIVERYMDRDLAGGNRFYGPVIHGNVTDSQLAWGNQTVSQSGGQHDEAVAPGFEEIAAVVSKIVAEAANFGLNDDGKGDIEAVGRELLTEVETGEPDRGKIRRWVASLKGILTPLAVQAGAGAGEGVHELAQQAVEALGNTSFYQGET